MTWRVIFLPQIWTTLAIIAALVARGVAQRRLSSAIIDDFVELVAYAAALWGVQLLLADVVKDGQDVQKALPLAAVTAILAYVAGRGIWRILIRKEGGDTQAKPVEHGEKQK